MLTSPSSISLISPSSNFSCSFPSPSSRHLVSKLGSGAGRGSVAGKVYETTSTWNAWQFPETTCEAWPHRPGSVAAESARQALSGQPGTVLRNKTKGVQTWQLSSIDVTVAVGMTAFCRASARAKASLVGDTLAGTNLRKFESPPIKFWRE